MYPLYSILQAACLFLRDPKPASTNLEPPLHSATEGKQKHMNQLFPQSHIRNTHLANPLLAVGDMLNISYLRKDEI